MTNTSARARPSATYGYFLLRFSAQTSHLEFGTHHDFSRKILDNFHSEKHYDFSGKSPANSSLHHRVFPPNLIPDQGLHRSLRQNSNLIPQNPATLALTHLPRYNPKPMATSDKSTPKTVYLFYGKDRYSLNQKLKFWQDQFVKKYGENALDVIYADDLNPPDFATNLETPPFLSEKRLIIVKDFLELGEENQQKQVASAIENTGDFCILIFQENEVPEKSNPIFKKITKIGHLEEFKALSPNEITQWIMAKAKDSSRTGSIPINISFFTANYLSQQCGPELWTISNELDKLALFADGKEITKEMIDNLCIPSLSSSVFKLTDEVAQKNIKASLKTFEILKNSGEDLIKIFFMLARHFRILTQVQELLSKGENSAEITRKLKQHPFVIQKTSQQAKNFNQDKLKKIYEEMLAIDTNMKTGIIKSYKSDNREYELAIEKLIISCCK